MNEKLRKEKAGLEQEYMRLKHANNTDNLTEIQVSFLLKNCRLSRSSLVAVEIMYCPICLMSCYSVSVIYWASMSPSGSVDSITLKIRRFWFRSLAMSYQLPKILY